MTLRPLFDADADVATWMFGKSGCQRMQFNLAIGLVDEAGEIRGGIMFTGWNGSDVEVHYYGPRHLTRRTVRLIMQIAGRALGVNRLTIRTRKPSMARGVAKLGAHYEGRIARLYGPTDADDHAGQQWAFYRETILKLANLENPDNVRRSA